MTKEEFKEKLKREEEKKFMNEMVDGWTAENYRIEKEANEEIKRLKEEIEKLEKEK